MFQRFLPQIHRASKLSTSKWPWIQFKRTISAWIDVNKARTSTSKLKNLDVEKLFTNSEVQRLLKQLTGIKLDRIFAQRVFDTQERSHFALMTEKMFQTSLEKMKEEGKHFLQFVPVKEPRPNITEVLSKDPLIEGFDNSKFVFVDITFDASNKDRTVVVREVDGTLRTATPEEHDRMNRIYFAQPDRPVNTPSLFKNPFLKEALDRNDHEYVLDYACYFYEPDDLEFVKLSCEIFDRTVADKKFDLLYSTRHFGPFVFYLLINGNIDPLLEYIATSGSLTDAANLIRLYKVVHPDWRVAIGSEDDDKKIVADFLKQNPSIATKMKNLELERSTAIERSTQLRQNEAIKNRLSDEVKLINKETIRTREGPLGNLADKYSVRMTMSSQEQDEKQATEGRKISVNARRVRRSNPVKEDPGKS